MKKNIFKILYISILFSLCVLSGCSQSPAQTQTDADTVYDKAETDAAIDSFIKKYNAVNFADEINNIRFSAQIADNYTGKNIYMSILGINDIFYSDNELFMCAESWYGEHILLKITSEQYSAIQSLSNDYVDFGNLHIIFTLNNAKPMFPTLNADFSFDISTPDDILADEDLSTSFDTKVIQGALVDIMEIRQ